MTFKQEFAARTGFGAGAMTGAAIGAPLGPIGILLGGLFGAYIGTVGATATVEILAPDKSEEPKKD